MTEKTRSGGTNGRAPLGYRNQRLVDEQGREVRTVVIDPVRAPLAQQAFALYGPGEWTLQSLAKHLVAQGLTTVPTPKLPSREVSVGTLNKLLTNPYYKGLVSFQGALYSGRHEALVDDCRQNCDNAWK